MKTNMKAKINDITNKIDDHISDNKVYYITTLIMMGVYMICLMLSSSVPFGKAFSIPGDSMVQSYSFIASQHDGVNSGNAFAYYTFDIAGFFDVYRVNILSYIIHPSLLIKYLIFPKSCLIYLFILEYISFYVFSPISLIYYLSNKHENRFDKHDNRLIYISLLYGLSNFALSFYMYETLLYLQFLPIILLGLEHLIYYKKPTLYICMLSYIIINDPYHAFILCEFLALYFLTLNYNSIKDFFIKGIRFAVSSLICALLSAISLLPFYFLFVTDSPYQGTDNKAPSLLKFYSSFIDVLSYYHVANLGKTISESMSAAAIYMSLLILFCIPMFLLCDKIKLNIRIKRILLLLVLFISFNNEMLNYVLHGFHYQSLVPNRQAAFFVFISALILSDTIYYIENIKPKIIVYSTLIIATIMTCIYCTHLDLNKFTSILTLCLIVIYVAAIIICGLVKKYNSKELMKILLYVAVLDILINAIFNFSFQISDKPTNVNVANEIDSIVDKYPELGEYYNSTEILGDNSDLINIGLTSKINSLSFFSSGFTEDTLRRISYYNIMCVLNNFSYKTGNPLADMMLHVKYHIEDINDDSAYSIYPVMDQYNNYAIHENPYYISMGFLIENKSVNDEIKRTDYKSCFDYQNMLSSYLGGNDIYNTISCEPITLSNEEEIQIDSSKNYFYTGDSYEAKNPNNTMSEYRTINIHLSDDVKGYLFASVDNFAYCIGEADENNHDFSIDYPKEYVDEHDDFKPIIAIFDQESFEELHNTLDNSILKDLDNDGHSIKANIDAKADGALYISIPYYSGWDIYIDGVKHEKTRYLGGMGVDITAGSHTVELKYTPPGMKSGIIITLITIISIILYSVISTIYHKKKTK